jgi:CBS domain-containing protein
MVVKSPYATQSAEVSVKDLTVLQAKRYGIYSCKSDLPLRKAAQIMVQEDISGLVVVDEDGYLVGIITRTDMLRATRDLEDWPEKPVSASMNVHVITVTPQDHLSHVVDLLLERQIHRVVIVQKEDEKLRPVGVISDADVIYHLTRAA